MGIGLTRTICFPFVIAAVFVLPACISFGWKKPGATLRDYQMDVAACNREAQSQVFGTGSIGMRQRSNFIDPCLITHGWTY